MSERTGGINIFTPDISVSDVAAYCAVLPVLPENREYTVLPGFCDVHVHFREPGFSYKGTIRAGSAAAARGGYTAVCTMPNLDPVPDCPDNLRVQTDLIKRDACVAVHPYGAITAGEKGTELADMEGLAPHVIAFSDDGRGVQDEELMRRAMLEAKRLGKVIAAHTEDDSVTGRGVIHDGAYAREHGLPGIPSESEWRQLKRDLILAGQTGCSYHVCHVSCKESVELIRRAKAEGVDVSCETAPHYLLLDDSMLKDECRFKMKPPIRAGADAEALIEGLLDGTIDMIATDHAPHSAAEKSGGLKDGVFGIVGLETAFPLLYTYLVRPGIITPEKLINLMCHAPRERFGLLPDDGFSIWDLGAAETIDPESFLSLGRATPFAGYEVYGTNMLTVLGGETVYKSDIRRIR